MNLPNDIILPPDIGWWPLAWGWWVVLGVILALIALLVWWLPRALKQRAIMNATTSLLEHAAQAATSEQQCQRFNQAIKRYLAAKGADQRILALSGSDWVDLLNKIHTLSDATRDALAEGSYRPLDIDPTATQQELTRWLKHASEARVQEVCHA